MRLPWDFLGVSLDPGVSSEMACQFLRLVCTLNLLEPNLCAAFLQTVPQPPIPEGHQPLGTGPKDGTGILAHNLWLYVQPRNFMDCFPGDTCAEALKKGMVSASNCNKLIINLQTLCAISHHLNDPLVATQVVLETQGAMFTVLVDPKGCVFHVPLADHLLLLQSILLPLGMRHGTNSHPIISTILWCLTMSEPFAFYRAQMQVPHALGTNTGLTELQTLVQGSDYVQKFNTVRSLVLRYCASASDGLARQILNSAALLVPNMLIACDVLERALEAFLRGAQVGVRASGVAAATLSLPPDCSVQEFVDICRGKHCNLLVLVLLRQMVPASCFTRTGSVDGSPGLSTANMQALVHVVDEILKIKPNPEREWDILAVYCFLVEIMQMPDWNMRHQQVCQCTQQALDSLSILGGTGTGTHTRLVDRFSFGVVGKRNPLVTHRFSKDMVLANTCLELYALKTVKRHIVHLPKSLAERVSDISIARKFQDLEQRGLDNAAMQPLVRQLHAESVEGPYGDSLFVLMHSLQRLLGAGCLLHKL